jgi:hypothetical protein
MLFLGVPAREQAFETSKASEKPKTARYQAQDRGRYKPAVLCRVFGVRKNAKPRLLYFGLFPSSNMAAVFVCRVIPSEPTPLSFL